MKVIYQPCSDDSARNNLQRTILNPVRLEDIEHFLEQSFVAKLREENPSGILNVWGLSPSNITRAAWLRMNPGDVVIFNVNKMVTVSARFTHRVHCRDLAIHLWGFKDKDSDVPSVTWENIYFVSDVCHQSIPYSDILLCATKKRGLSFLDFTLSDSDAILLKYGDILLGVDENTVTLAEAREDILQDMETDGVAARPTRKEQRYIVKHLFGGASTGVCCICGNEYPRSLLVAAHIKKRAACDKKEKLDIEHIAVPMCRMGCDQLFELGFISVDKGRVVRHPSMGMPGVLSDYVDGLVGNLVSQWGGKTRKYFDWHRSSHGFDIS